MVIGFITTYAVSASIAINDGSSNPAKTRLPIQHYVIKFVSDVRQVGGFLRVLWFPPPIKMTTMIFYS